MSSSSSEEEEAHESLASGRNKRSNAGARMSRLLEAEDEDDFYKTTYGGFEEEVDDNDYASEASEADDVDSDFDIDENDELKSDDEGDELKRKRKGVHTKAYKEPKKPKTDEPKPKKKPKPKSKPKPSTVQIYHAPMQGKAVRRSTTQKSAQTVALQEERAIKAKMMKDIAAKKNVAEVRRLTQEELLAEAKITEEINLKALETYQRMELEKKKARGQKQIFRGPLVKYVSTTMPLIDDIDSAADSGAGSEAEINVDDDDIIPPQEENDIAAKRSQLKPHEKCSRTFVTFTDEINFKEIFHHKKARAPLKQYCAVTRAPAKYFDPITQLPYANAQAFKIIRDAYAQYMDSQVAAKRTRVQVPVSS